MCQDVPLLKKLFRPARAMHWNIIEKETIDEVFFRTTKARNRLLLELMARGGMRVSEVLNLTANDVDGRRLIIRDSKGGRGEEVAFIPPKLAVRLKQYIKERRMEPRRRIFSITYAAARLVVKKAGELVGIHLRPHDLRRHSATYASRAGTPIEIVSKVILRHTNLSMTQRYLGTVSDAEVMRWFDNLLFHDSPATNADMALLPDVLGCSFDRLRTGSLYDVPFRYASEPTPCGCPVARPPRLARMAGGTPIFFALAALRSVPLAGSQFRGLATAIREISGLVVS